MPRGRGRPARFAAGELRNTTLWLRPEDLHWLDAPTLAARQRGEGGQDFNRSAVLRGLLAGLRDAGLELGECSSEDEVRARAAGRRKRRD